MSEAAAWWMESSALLKQRLANLSVAEDLSIMVLVEVQIKGLRLGDIRWRVRLSKENWRIY
jgi:hypothetical protein